MHLKFKFLQNTSKSWKFANDFVVIIKLLKCIAKDWQAAGFL